MCGISANQKKLFQISQKNVYRENNKQQIEIINLEWL